MYGTLDHYYPHSSCLLKPSVANVDVVRWLVWWVCVCWAGWREEVSKVHRKSERALPPLQGWWGWCLRSVCAHGCCVCNRNSPTQAVKPSIHPSLFILFFAYYRTKCRGTNRKYPISLVPFLSASRALQGENSPVLCTKIKYNKIKIKSRLMWWQAFIAAAMTAV